MRLADEQELDAVKKQSKAAKWVAAEDEQKIRSKAATQAAVEAASVWAAKT